MADKTTSPNTTTPKYPGLSYMDRLLSFWGGTIIALIALQLLIGHSRKNPDSPLAIFAGPLTIETAFIILGSIVGMGLCVVIIVSLIACCIFKSDLRAQNATSTAPKS